MAVIDLQRKREERQPHTTGQAVCGGCRHVWTAVAPVGDNQLECPSCHTMRGLWRYNYGGHDGESYFKCNYCQGYVFEILRPSVVCIGCGARTTFEELCNA